MNTVLETPPARTAPPSLKENILHFLGQHRRLIAGTLAGIVIAVGSTGLLLGAITVAISSLLVSAGMGLLEAMTIGFFVTSLAGLALGAVLLATTAGPLIERLPQGPPVRPDR